MRTVAARAWLVVLCLENTLAGNKQLRQEKEAEAGTWKTLHAMLR